MSTNAVVHLIDDDEGVRQAVAFLLSTSGFAVRVYSPPLPSSKRWRRCSWAAS